MDFLKDWLKMNLDFVQSTIVSQISVDYAQLIVAALIDKLKLTVEVLTDENPDNKAQLVEVWGTFTSDPKVLQAVNLAIDEVAASVDDSGLKASIELVRTQVVNTLVALTDANKLNGEQIAQIWKDFFKSPEFTAFAITYAFILLDKLPLPTWLKNILNALIKH